MFLLLLLQLPRAVVLPGRHLRLPIGNGAHSRELRPGHLHAGDCHLRHWTHGKGHLDIGVSATVIILVESAIANQRLSLLLSHLSDTYSQWTEEGIIVNALGVTLVALGIVVSFAVRRSNAPATAKVYVTERL